MLIAANAAARNAQIAFVAGEGRIRCKHLYPADQGFSGVGKRAIARRLSRRARPAAVLSTYELRALAVERAPSRRAIGSAQTHKKSKRTTCGETAQGERAAPAPWKCWSKVGGAPDSVCYDDRSCFHPDRVPHIFRARGRGNLEDDANGFQLPTHRAALSKARIASHLILADSKVLEHQPRTLR